MQRDAVGFRSGDVAARPLNLLFRVVDGGGGFIDLGDKLGDLERGENLPGMHPVTDIYVDLLNVAGDLPMDLDVLVGKELACDRQLV